MWFVPGVVSVGGFALLVLAGLGARSRRILVAAQHREGLFESTLETEAEDARSMGSTATATATATRAARGVSVAELVRKSGAQRPRDPRGEAIQATVSQIKPLSNFIYRAMQVGVLLVALGTFLGGVWADKSWGRFWGWDPKEVWALTTLIVYLVPLHGRFAGWVSTFGLVAASVICYNSVLMAWYGVNWVLGVGLHSYGFAEGGGQGIVVFSALALIALVIGAAFRRHLGSRNDLAYGTN
jgi:ABC-type transport system involved in cytochrome c biogenesis permease subunit